MSQINRTCSGGNQLFLLCRSRGCHCSPVLCHDQTCSCWANHRGCYLFSIPNESLQMLNALQQLGSLRGFIVSSGDLTRALVEYY